MYFCNYSVLIKLFLQHLRNHTETECVIDSPYTVISGLNGAGKTSILEAIHILSLGRSFRTTTDKKLLQFAQPFWAVSGNMGAKISPETVRVAYSEADGKKLWLSQNPIGRLSQFIGHYPVITLLPNKTEVIIGPASERRTFLDSFLCQQQTDYLEYLTRYQIALKQRNSLLHNPQTTNDLLSAWEEQMAVNGQQLILYRKQLLQAIVPYFQEYFNRFEYNLSLKLNYSQSQLLDSYVDLRKVWEKYRQKDFQLGYTSVGPHRDDIEITVENRPLKEVGSQGQIHSASIALYFSLIAYQRTTKQLSLWLLLDDIFDKLDPLRTQILAQQLLQFEQTQVFITDSQIERCQAIANQIKASLWLVKNGQVQTLY